MNIIAQLSSLMRAGYPLLYLVTHEEQRALRSVEEAAASVPQPRSVCVWTVTTGWTGAVRNGATDPASAVPSLLSEPRSENCAAVLCDFHPYLEDPTVVRTVRDALEACKARGTHLVLLSPRLVVPTELEKDLFVLNYPLPDREDIERILDYVAESASVTVPDGLRRPLVEAATGLTWAEAENAFALTLVRHRTWSEDAVRTVHEQKAQALRRTGLLEYYHTRDTLDDVGGLDLLKDWLRRRARAFGDEAREFGLEPPRGVLLLGVQGCGKSLTAKAAARSWNLPLLRLDMGRIYSSLVGESEANLRTALQVASAMAPCVLWIDEIEKGAAGAASSGTLDSGVTARVVGTLLTWMQERDESRPVFVAATANSVHTLPPELLRKGRLDEIFFVDLPDEAERRDILSIHIRKRRRDPGSFDLGPLSQATDGFSGAEIEQAVRDALYLAFDRGRDLQQEDLEEAVQATVPLSRLRGEEIAQLRQWAGQRARPASSRTAHRIDGRRISL